MSFLLHLLLGASDAMQMAHYKLTIIIIITWIQKCTYY